MMPFYQAVQVCPHHSSAHSCPFVSLQTVPGEDFFLPSDMVLL